MDKRGALDELLAAGYLKIIGGDYFPAYKLIAEMDSDVSKVALGQIDAVLVALRNLYMRRDDKNEFSFDEIMDEVRQVAPGLDENDVIPGLFLATEFGYFASWSTPLDTSGQIEIRTVHLVEAILDFKSAAETWRRLSATRNQPRLEPETALSTLPRPATPQNVRELVDIPAVDLRFEILRVIAQNSPRPVHKYNLIGREGTQGDLERVLGRPLTLSERDSAYRAFDELLHSRHLVPTYSDLVAPELWVVVTDSGRDALVTGVFDSLDAILAEIASKLPTLRRGARLALTSGAAHSLEQAAHSARELIDQTLKLGAPDDEIKAQPWYQPDPTSKSGVTRRMRIKHLRTKYGAERSEAELAVAAGACDFALATADKLMALAHAREPIDVEEVADAIDAADIALKSIFRAGRRGRQAAAGQA